MYALSRFRKEQGIKRMICCPPLDRSSPSLTTASSVRPEGSCHQRTGILRRWWRMMHHGDPVVCVSLKISLPLVLCDGCEHLRLRASVYICQVCNMSVYDRSIRRGEIGLRPRSSDLICLAAAFFSLVSCLSNV